MNSWGEAACQSHRSCPVCSRYKNSDGTCSHCSSSSVVSSDHDAEVSVLTYRALTFFPLLTTDSCLQVMLYEVQSVLSRYGLTFWGSPIPITVLSKEEMETRTGKGNTQGIDSERLAFTHRNDVYNQWKA